MTMAVSYVSEADRDNKMMATGDYITSISVTTNNKFCKEPIKWKKGKEKNFKKGK